MIKGILGTLLAIFVTLGLIGGCLVMSFNHIRKCALTLAARGEFANFRGIKTSNEDEGEYCQ